MAINSRRYASSRVPAQALADKVETKCAARNRMGVLNGQINTQKALIRSAEIAIKKYEKEIRLISQKMEALPETRRGMQTAEQTPAPEPLTAEAQHTVE